MEVIEVCTVICCMRGKFIWLHHSKPVFQTAYRQIGIQCMCVWVCARAIGMGWFDNDTRCRQFSMVWQSLVMCHEVWSRFFQLQTDFYLIILVTFPPQEPIKMIDKRFISIGICVPLWLYSSEWHIRWTIFELHTNTNIILFFEDSIRLVRHLHVHRAYFHHIRCNPHCILFT